MLFYLGTSIRRAEYSFGMHQKWCLSYCWQLRKRHHFWCIPNKCSALFILSAVYLSFFLEMSLKKEGGKGVSVVEMLMYNSEHHAKSCENLIFPPRSEDQSFLGFWKEEKFIRNLQFRVRWNEFQIFTILSKHLDRRDTFIASCF